MHNRIPELIHPAYLSMLSIFYSLCKSPWFWAQAPVTASLILCFEMCLWVSDPEHFLSLDVFCYLPSGSMHLPPIPTQRARLPKGGRKCGKVRGRGWRSGYLAVLKALRFQDEVLEVRLQVYGCRRRTQIPEETLLGSCCIKITVGRMDLKGPVWWQEKQVGGYRNDLDEMSWQPD